MGSYAPDPLSRNATLFQATNKVLMVLTRVSKHTDGKHDAIQIEKLLKATSIKALESLRKPLLEAVRKKFSRRRYRDPSAPGTYPKMLSQELRNSIEVTEIGRGDTKTMGEMTGFAIRTRGEGRESNKLMWLSRPNNPWHTSRNGKRLAIPVSMAAKKASARGKGPRELGIPLVLFSYRKGKEFKYLLVEHKGDKKPGGRMNMVVHYVLWKGSLNLSKRRGLDDAVNGCASLIKNTLEKAQI